MAFRGFNQTTLQFLLQGSTEDGLVLIKVRAGSRARGSCQSQFTSSGKHPSPKKGRPENPIGLSMRTLRNSHYGIVIAAPALLKPYSSTSAGNTSRARRRHVDIAVNERTGLAIHESDADVSVDAGLRFSSSV